MPGKEEIKEISEKAIEKAIGEPIGTVIDGLVFKESTEDESGGLGTVYMDDEAGQVKNTIVYRSDADFYKNIPQIKKDFSKAPFRRRTQYYGEDSQSISDESAKG